MRSMTAILIDDEFTALKGLQQKVEKLFPNIRVLQTFQKPEDAISQLEREPPDILFLDIEMPRMSGFDLLAALKQVNFQVVFVTAYNEYALKALKESAIGYVLKPVDDAELVAAVSKAMVVIEQKQTNESNAKLIEILTETISNTKKLIIPTEKGLSFIPYEEVIHLEGYEGYTKFHLANAQEIVSSYNLGKFDKYLPPTFFKCHKSHIINIEKVSSFENEGYLVLEKGHRVPISKANRKVFIQLFNSDEIGARSGVKRVRLKTVDI